MAALHPQVVHFTIVLVIIGVAFRLVSLLGRPAFAGPAATTLLLLAAVSAVVSVRSGTAAHGPVEQIPGVRPAVVAHEEWGERTQTVLLVLGAIELIGLAFRRSPRVRLVHAAAAVVGLAAVICVYEAGEYGGRLVYSYAGGVGIRSGDPKDVERLLLAGFYHQALLDRREGHSDEAAKLIAAASSQFPSDLEVRLMAAESLLVDQENPEAALEALGALVVPSDNRALRLRHATLEADAYEAIGMDDSALATLESVVSVFPNARLQQRIDSLKGGGTRSAAPPQ